MKKINIKKVNYLPLLILALLAYGCGQKEGVDKTAELEGLKKQQSEIAAKIKTLELELVKEGKISADNTKVKTVVVTPVVLKTFNHYVEIQGKVDSDENIMVSAESNGNILRIPVKRGDRVKKGQALAILDAVVLKNSIEEVKTQLSLQTNVFEKRKALWSENVGTEIQYLQDKTAKEATEAKLATLQSQLRMSIVKSPIDGIVDDILKKEGEMLSPGVPAFRVIRYGDYKIVGELAESYIGKVNAGDEVTINFPDLKKEIKTKITVVGSSVNTLNRTFSVEIRLTGNTGNIKPNMIAYLKIKDFTQKNALVAPINTVQKSSDGLYVYVAEDKKATRKVVKVDYTYGSEALISDGLKAGDNVVTFGYSELTEGQPIAY